MLKKTKSLFIILVIVKTDSSHLLFVGKKPTSTVIQNGIIIRVGWYPSPNVWRGTMAIT
jgi:hypothetical protein